MVYRSLFSRAYWRSFMLIAALASANGLVLPGYEDKRTVLMCASETRTIVCEMGKFIWIRQSRIGVSLSYTQDMTTGVESCPINIDCQEPYGAAYQGTTFRSFRGLSVPDVTLTCMDNEQQANYLYIEYSCITENLLDVQPLCHETTRTFPEGYAATPNFPLRAPNTLYDCTCTVRPTSSNMMNITVVLMYGSLPGPDCNEEMWVEDQDGNRFLEYCSPLTRVLFHEVLFVSNMKLRFVRRSIPDDFDPEDAIKVWYGLEAPGLMEVICVDTSNKTSSAVTPPSPSPGMLTSSAPLRTNDNGGVTNSGVLPLGPNLNINPTTPTTTSSVANPTAPNVEPNTTQEPSQTPLIVIIGGGVGAMVFIIIITVIISGSCVYHYRHKSHVDDTTVSAPVPPQQTRLPEPKSVWEGHINPVFPGNSYAMGGDPNYDKVGPDMPPNYEDVPDLHMNYETVPDLDTNYETVPDLDQNYEVVTDLDPPYENVSTLYPPRYAPTDMHYDVSYEKLQEAPPNR